MSILFYFAELLYKSQYRHKTKPLKAYIDWMQSAFGYYPLIDLIRMKRDSLVTAHRIWSDYEGKH